MWVFHLLTIPVHSFPISEVEKSEFCQALIRQRISEGLADDGQIFPDVASCHIKEPVDGFLGGFPCQGVSRAGAGLGLADSRSGLVSHVWRLWDEQVEQGYDPTLGFYVSNQQCAPLPFFQCPCEIWKKTKAVHTASSGNLSCWKMSVRSWLRSFGVCLNTSSRKIEHTHAHKYTWSFCHPGLASVCIRGYAGSPEARIESCLCHDQWQDGWSSRGLLSQPNGVKREGYFNHFQCPFPAKIWRERVFFLMAKPNFDLFQANSMVFWRKHCHHKVWVEHCSISRYKQVIYPKIVACTWPDFYHVSIWECLRIGVTKASYIYIYYFRLSV